MPTLVETLRSIAEDEQHQAIAPTLHGAANAIDELSDALTSARQKVADQAAKLEVHDRIHHYIGQTFEGAAPTELPAYLDRLKRDLDEARAEIVSLKGKEDS